MKRCKELDIDDDDVISLESLHDFFDSDNKIHSLMEYVDSDGDGLIDFEQCISVLNTIGFRLPEYKDDKSQRCFWGT